VRPVCDLCGAALTRRGWRGAIALFTCSNTSCPDFGKRTYQVHDQVVESPEPDGKETK